MITNNIMNTNTNTPTITTVNTRPKRPLSAFNLFYRFKRQQVLHALASNDNNLGMEEISRLIEAPPGLEHHDPSSSTPTHDDLEALNALRRSIIINELKPNMNARDAKARSHRKDHGMKGAISFVELGKIMNSSWKKCDGVAKAVFDELSQEGREKYRVLAQEYNAMNKELGLTTTTKTSKKKKDSKKRTRDGDEPPTKTKKQSKKKKQQPTKNEALPPPPLLKSDASSGSEMSERELAETMLRLQSSTPLLKMQQRKMSGPLKKRWLTDNEVASPSLLDLLSSNNTGTQNVVGDNSGIPRMMNTTPPVHHQPRAVVHQPHLPRADPITISPIQQGFSPSSLQSNEAALMSRVRALEQQLAEERIRVQNMAALEEQVLSKQREQENLNKYIDVLNRNRMTTTAMTLAPAPQSPIQQQRPVIQNDGLWSLVSASMIHPSVQAQERNAMLHKMVGDQSGPTIPMQPSLLVRNGSGIPRAA